MVYIKRIKKGNRVYLYKYESYRENGKVKTRHLEYLGVESDERGVPKPKKSRTKTKPMYPRRSQRAGDVKLLWTIAEKVGIPQTIDQVCIGLENVSGPTPGKLLTVWAINHILDPASASKVARWAEPTILPDLLGIAPTDLRRENLYAALDAVCSKDICSGMNTDLIAHIEDVMFQKWRQENPAKHREKETVAYDMTTVMTYSETCPLAERGYNAKKTNDKQYNLGMLVSKSSRYPIAHMIFPGNFQAKTTLSSLYSRIIDLGMEPGTLVWDRGNTSADSVEEIEALGWEIICGVPKITTDAKNILKNTDVPLTPECFVPSKNGDVYALQKEGKLYGKDRKVTVYVNTQKRLNEIKRKNMACVAIEYELSDLQERCTSLTREEIDEEVEDILGNLAQYFNIEVGGSDGNLALKWEYNKESIELSQATGGKYLLYATNPDLNHRDVVREYMEKDFIEKTFRDLKSEEDMMPVRHRLEPRVRAYFFMISVAHRIRTGLRYYIAEIPKKERKYEMDELLHLLRRVEFVRISEQETETYWYLNLLKKTTDQLDAMGFKDLFEEKTYSEL